MLKKLCCFLSIALCILLQAALVFSTNHENAANNLVDIINKNRTDNKLPRLSTSTGLGCIALQFAKECKDNCTANNTIHCQPPEDDFTEIFAPDCGVELPTFGPITGYILGCQNKHLDPQEAFSRTLVEDKKTLSMVKNRTHTQVGVGVIGGHKHKAPYIWCVLFSNGKANTTFVLEDLGEGIEQKTGCYSGSSIHCSKGEKITHVWILFFYVFPFLHFHLRFL